MSQFFTERERPFVAGAAMNIHLRVTLTAGQLQLADATTKEIGTLFRNSTSGKEVGVTLRTAQGTIQMVASEAIGAGAEVFAAAGGKVATSGTVSIGHALSAGSGDNSIIEVLRNAA